MVSSNKILVKGEQNLSLKKFAWWSCTSYRSKTSLFVNADKQIIHFASIGCIDFQILDAQIAIELTACSLWP